MRRVQEINTEGEDS